MYSQYLQRHKGEQAEKVKTDSHLNFPPFNYRSIEILSGLVGLLRCSKGHKSETLSN